MNDEFYVGLVVIAVTLGIACGIMVGFLTFGGGLIFAGLLSYLNGGKGS